MYFNWPISSSQTECLLNLIWYSISHFIGQKCIVILDLFSLDVHNSSMYSRSLMAKHPLRFYGCCFQDYEIDGDPFRNLRIHFHLRRHPTFYVVNIIVPCIALSLLASLALLLPSDCGEKVSLEITVMLAFTIFLLMLSENVPRTDTIPLLGKHYIYTACLHIT